MQKAIAQPTVIEGIHQGTYSRKSVITVRQPNGAVHDVLWRSDVRFKPYMIDVLLEQEMGLATEDSELGGKALRATRNYCLQKVDDYYRLGEPLRDITVSDVEDMAAHYYEGYFSGLKKASLI